MRVTHVITRLIVGGAQENTISTVLGLQGKPSLETDLISGPTTGPEGSLESSFAAQPGLLRIHPRLVRPVHPLFDWLAWRDLTRDFRRTRPDIVHTHSGKAGVLGRLAARKARVPLIIHTIHGPSFGPFQGALANFIFRSAEKAAGRATDHFVCVAHAMTEQYLAAGIGVPAQYTRILSGFNLRPFLSAPKSPELRQKLGIGPDDFVLGKIARLAPLKGHEDLIRAAPALVKKYPQLKILLVGDGPSRGEFAALIESLGLNKHFVFAGLIPPAAVPAHVGIMNALAHLSLREGLPRALPQALAAGVPVVACDCDGAREVCLDQKTGFLVRPGDFPALEARISQLIESPELRRKLGEAGRSFVERSFSVEAMVDNIYTLYQRLWADRQNQA